MGKLMDKITGAINDLGNDLTGAGWPEGFGGGFAAPGGTAGGPATFDGGTPLVGSTPVPLYRMRVSSGSASTRRPARRSGSNAGRVARPMRRRSAVSANCIPQRLRPRWSWRCHLFGVP